jgi:hypothetical protein
MPLPGSLSRLGEGQGEGDQMNDRHPKSKQEENQ